MERMRGDYKILVVLIDGEYHIRINNKWQLSASFDTEEEAKNYACGFVDCLKETENMFKSRYCR